MRLITDIETLTKEEQDKIMQRIIELTWHQTGTLFEVRKLDANDCVLQFKDWQCVSPLMDEIEANELKNITNLAGENYCEVVQSQNTKGKFRTLFNCTYYGSYISSFALSFFAQSMNGVHPIIDENRNNTQQILWTKESHYVDGYPAIGFEYITTAYSHPNQDRTHNPNVTKYLIQLKKEGFDIRYSSSDRYFEYASIPLTAPNYQLLMTKTGLTLLTEPRGKIALSSEPISRATYGASSPRIFKENFVYNKNMDDAPPSDDQPSSSGLG